MYFAGIDFATGRKIMLLISCNDLLSVLLSLVFMSETHLIQILPLREEGFAE